MSGEDSATILADFVTSLDNLPSELEHIMAEIKGKEQTIFDLRSKAEQREIAIAKFHKANGLLANNPKEAQTVQKLKSDYIRMQQLSDDKVRLAERALAIVTRHCGRFERELIKMQNNGIAGLVPIAPPPIPATAPASPYTSMLSPSLAASTSSAPPLPSPAIGVGQIDRSLKRKNAPASIVTPPASLPMPPGPPSAPTMPSPQPTPALPVLAVPNRPARPSRLSTSFTHGVHSPAGSDAESRASGDQQPRLPKRNKRKHPPNARRHSPDEDEDAEGEEDDGEDASFEVGDYSGGGADDGALYCYCQRVSYGQMVGCDNPDCRYEWFHFECAGLKVQPEGAWFCKDCAESMSGQAASRRRR